MRRGIRIDWGAATDVGRVRDNNEDALSAVPENGVGVLSDGMGGHRAGEVASRLAVDTFLDMIDARTARGRPAGGTAGRARIPTLVSSAWAANDAVFRRSRDDADLHGMGCTLVALRFEAGRASFASVGDSRLYLFREGHLKQITEDHTQVRLLERMGIRIDPEEARRIRGILMRAVGTEQTVEVDYGECPVHQSDTWLLCSDGLTDEVADGEIREILAGAAGAQEAARRCVERALQAGGRDNVSVLVARVVEGPENPGDAFGAVSFLRTWRPEPDDEV